MPTIDDFVVLIDLYRRQHVEDVGILRDQIVVALAKPRVQIVAGVRRRRGRSFVESPYRDCRMIAEERGKLPLSPVECLFYRLMINIAAWR